MWAPGRRKPVKRCQAGAGKAGEDGLERSWLEEEAVAKFTFNPERCSPLQLCRACTGKSSNCDMWGAAPVTLHRLREKCLASREAVHKTHQGNIS